MINIIIDFSKDEIEIEGYVMKHSGSDAQLHNIAMMIQHILDKAYSSGETLCLETKNKEGIYTEISRWYYK